MKEKAWTMNDWKAKNIGSSIPFPKIMGILNATPDSFSGDGTLDHLELIDRGLSMLDQGADILDIGAESSRPFSIPIDEEEERRRVLPVIKGLRKLTDAPLSIDTRRHRTARAALDEGVDMINDITGLIDPDMRHLAAERSVGVIVMHMKGAPENMQRAPVYADVLTEVKSFLRSRIDQALKDGIAPDKLIVDPGIGFGKTLEHNLTLIRNLNRIRINNCPVLLGVSRKSMIGEILNLPVDARIEGSLAAAAVGVLNGADILRVHDVMETRRFFTVFHHMMRSA
ncbi:MAG: dihydropteroate synthase [bacterium]